jgi:hypothetical protein
VLGHFEGRVRYDPVTGNYSRTFVPPVQVEGADIEFRVLVNDELDDTMPVVRLRGRPRIDAASLGSLARGGVNRVVELSGIDFSSTPTVRATTSDVLVMKFRVLEPNRVEATIRAPSTARVGWSGLQVVSSDGRVSNAWPLFVFDSAETTIVATEASDGSGSAALEWFGGAPPGPPGWRLERSGRADFSSVTTLYVGGARGFSDPAPASDVWFYRVR